MKYRSRLTALLLALMMLLSLLPAAALADAIQTVDDYQSAVQRVKDELNKPSVPQEQENSFTLTRTTQMETIVRSETSGTVEQAGSYALPLTGRLTLTAPAADGYQWQIKVGDVWANIVEDNGPSITLTYAKVQTALTANAAQVRCVLLNGGQLTTSAEVTVTVDTTVTTETKTVEQSIPVTSFYGDAVQSPAQRLNAANEGSTLKNYSITINYLFENNEVASEPYVASLAAGSAFSATVTFPDVKGYLPYYNGNQQNSLTLNFESVTEDVNINVVYKPTNVDYTVIHYWQNVEDDKYTEHERETRQGLTGKQVPEVKKEYDGFYALLYERPTIAAAGNTVIEVYYDRNYYLMNFDLDGGYGVEPIYARYGAAISIGTPTKPGYTFTGWDKDLPTTMPAEHSKYTAQWEAGDTAKVTVVVWGENPDDEEYSFYKNAEIMATPGEKLTLDDLQGKLVCGKEEHTHNSSCRICAHSGAHTRTLECYGITSEPVDPNNFGDKDARTHFEDNCTNTSWGSYTCKGLKQYLKDGSVCQYKDGSGDWPNRTYTYYYFLYYGGKYYSITENQYNNWKTNTGKSVDHSRDTYYVYEGKTNVCTHTHTDACYTCGKEEHTHTSACYFNTSFMENPNLWKLVGSDEVTVAADGTTIMNVYYDRVEFTLHFRKKNSGTDDYGTIQAKWGANIREQFNAKSTQAGTSNWSENWNAGQPWTSYLDAMPAENRTYYAYEVDGTSTAYYYVEGLDGEDELFYRSVASGTGLSVSEEEFIKINGFTFNANRSTKENEDFDGAKFYYTRNSYTLKFFNRTDELTDKAKTVKYEAPLKDYYFEPAYPSDLEPNAYVFAGWYTTAGCYEGSEADLSTMTMPAADVILYAKWVPKTHTVKTYLTKEGMEKGEDVLNTWDAVPHGTVIPESEQPTKPENGAYTFVGWFYISETGEEKAFDFSMPVNRDLNLYAKWNSNTLKKYKVSFVLQNNHDVKVADDLTGSGLAGTTKTFDAKGGAELYSDYQEGYFPTLKSQSLTLDIEKDELTLIFEYVQKEAVPYTVKYINTETNTNVFDGTTVEDKVVNDNKKAVVTETFKAISGYLPDAYQKRLVVTEDGENILYFYYTKDTAHAYYKITHYTENLATDGQGNKTWTEYASSQAIGDIGQTYTAESVTIPGFTFDSTVEGTVQSGELTADGLELKLYYTRNSYPYEVRYLKQGTGEELHEPKKETAKYGQIVSEEAIDIQHYELVSETPQTLNIKVEEGEEAKLNVLIFYYQEKEATINYVAVGPEGYNEDGTPKQTVAGSVDPTSESVKVLNGIANGSTATAVAPTYRFAGWFNNAKCEGEPLSRDAKYTPVRPGSTLGEDGTVTGGQWLEKGVTYYAKFEYNLTTLTITKTGMDSIDQGQSFLFKVTGYGLPSEGLTIAINGNGSETISGLTVGQTYTVTEISDWSWRYSADAQTITLQVTDNKVTMDNSRVKTQWLDGDSYVKNDFGN